jgi:Protein of unknown function (DUF3500)
LGLRLEEVPGDIAEGVLQLLKASLAPEGYQNALAAMRMSHFLGEPCGVPKVMNKLSYNFFIFGVPSATDAWGWLLYGHHLCLSWFLKDEQIVISPTFTGAEPNMIDAGPWAGTTILHEESCLGLELMQSLDSDKQKQPRPITI